MSKRQDRAKSTVLVDPIFGFHFMLVVGGKESDAVRKFCKRLNLPMPDVRLDENRGCFCENESSRYNGLIWVEAKCGASTIAHECAHATAHVCRVFELDPRHADEFQASYTGWLVKELTKLYWRKK